MDIIKELRLLEKKHNITLRPQQEEIIKYVLFQWLGKKQNNVFIEAPTGSGKSCIAFFVSEIMNKLNKTGYILTSDISLQNQYVTDSKKYKFHRPDVKGVDNYDCTENGNPYSSGVCKLKHLSGGRQKNLKCYSGCPYIKARTAAAESDTCILNYNYYMLMHNYVRQDMGNNAPFQIRDFTIYDEAHKILDIVQEMYAPLLNKNIFENIKNLEIELNKNNYILRERVSFSKNFYSIFTKLRLSNDSKESLSLLKELYSLLMFYKKEIKNPVEDYIVDLFDKEDGSVFDILYLTEFIKVIDEFYSKIEDYIELIDKTSLDTMFVNKQETCTKYNFINEYYLIKKNLLDNSKLNLFMSATLGEDFPKMLGCVDYVYKTLDSDFDFSNSPIYVYKKFFVNFSNKDVIFPSMITELDSIIEKNHLDDRGLIHTSSYSNMKYIKENSKHKKRLIDYEKSNEKELAIDALKQANFILMGPSLIEGIDLKDDISRFQIIFKIPYPSLADNFVKYKFEKNKDWYIWLSRIKIQQALGRSIRHKDDYAISYVLDSNFIKMIPMLPQYIKNRIKMV